MEETNTGSSTEALREARVTWVALVVAVVVVLGTAAAFLRWTSPEPYKPYGEIRPIGDRTAMQEAMSVERVRERMAELLELGPRLPGQPGYQATRDHIREHFVSLGLDPMEQTYDTRSPLTRHSHFAVEEDAGFRPVPGVELYPLMPNMIQPVVTPPGGLEGELVLLSPEAIRHRESFKGAIGVIDGREGKYDTGFGFAWNLYAGLGLEGVIVTHPKGLMGIPWDRVYPTDREQEMGMVANLPINYPRFAASPEVLEYVGRRARLECESRWVEAEASNLFALLNSGTPSRELLVLAVSYDAFASLPDLAVGANQALQLATFLQLAEGLSAYQDRLGRDVLLFANGSRYIGNGGDYEFTKLLGLQGSAARVATATGGTSGRLARLGLQADENRAKLVLVEAALRVVRGSGFLQSLAETESGLKSLSGPQAKFFQEQFSYVMDSLILEVHEPYVQARVTLERLGPTDRDSPELADFLAKKARLDRARSAAGQKPLSLLESNSAYIEERGVRGKLVARLESLRAHHERELRRIEERVAVARVLDRYDNISFFETLLAPSEPGRRADQAESVAISDPSGNDSIVNVMMAARNALEAEVGGPVPELSRHLDDAVIRPHLNPYYPEQYFMYKMLGYAHFTFVNLGRRGSFLRLADPGVPAGAMDLESLEGSLSLVGETMLSLASGNGTFEAIPDRSWVLNDYGGRVLLSGVGQSIIPDYPLAGAFVFNKSLPSVREWATVGRYNNYFVATDPYGRFELPEATAEWVDWATYYAGGHRISPTAAGFDERGVIAYIKNEGRDAQRLFSSMNVRATSEAQDVTIVTFRADPVTMLELVNPRTLQNYSVIDPLSAEGLAPLDRIARFEEQGAYTLFMEPDQAFIAMLKSGMPGNENYLETQAYVLNSHDVDDPRNTASFARGYLAADHSFFPFVARETADSMIDVNDYRLDLQNRFRMADEQTNEHHAKASQLEKRARQEALPQRDQSEIFKDSASFSMLNHPVLRKNLFEAVIGILYFLALLVPFVFFFEKLIFNFSDIRKQLAAQTVIFLAVFLLLRLLHPAFEMIRSSLMILLGFVIILISGGITVLFSSKFKENFEELRRKRGQVAAAEANTMGVVATAFALGLNNMHRRKLRTWLTAGTLVLLTFVMISFTSIRQALQDSQVAIGRASYQGVLIKRDSFFPIRPTERLGIRNKYGEEYEVVERRAWIGGLDTTSPQRAYVNPNVSISARDGETVRTDQLDTILKCDPDEPLAQQVRFVAGDGWFTSEDILAETPPVLLSDETAETLGLTQQAVERGGAFVTIQSMRFRVHALFDSESLNGARDLDGTSLLPFDIEAADAVMRGSGIENIGILVADETPRLDAARAAIIPAREYPLNAPSPASERILSLAIVMDGVPYGQASEEIENYLVRTGEAAYYGLDRIAYRGAVTRGTSASGILDLLIPLVIAGITVLNTMRGSVYERRGEIMVYNAVGIAPRYIFFMFFAEAIVYSVVGCLLGYLLSQGVGRVLTEVGLTGGLNMTYASLSSIYASLTIVAAVLLSTWFPAKGAMKIAAPAEKSGWELPEPKEGRIAFDLPFTFRPIGRIAVLEFLYRFLREHGEGSSGQFFAGEPDFGVERPPSGEGKDEDDLTPWIACQVWLKPYDAGVSQRMTVAIPYDNDTGQFKARIELVRLSGTSEAWMRANQGFVSSIRRRFLHWRAVDAEMKKELFEGAAAKLRQAAQKEFSREEAGASS